MKAPNSLSFILLLKTIRNWDLETVCFYFVSLVFKVPL